MKGGHMPTDGVNIDFPKSKARSPAAAAPQMPANPADTELNPNTADEPPATKHVEDLCRRMGIAIPQYRITPAVDPSSAGPSASPSSNATAGAQLFFDGYADFGADSIKVPAGLGCVSNVYLKKNARERVAEEVLLWLVREERSRVAEADELLAQLESQGP